MGSTSFKSVINLFSISVKWEQKLSVLLRIKHTHNRCDFQKKDRERRKEKAIHARHKVLPFT